MSELSYENNIRSGKYGEVKSERKGQFKMTDGRLLIPFYSGVLNKISKDELHIEQPIEA